MPHGAGHIGGGHHGGGFFGGGGFHHHHHHHHGGFHHHHHHRHHSHHGWWYLGGTSQPYGYGYRYRRVVALLFVISFIIILAAVLSIAFGLRARYGKDSDNSDITKEYALTDKVILSYNSHFCQGLQATSVDRATDTQSNATLLLLNSRPPLTEHESFNLSETAFLNLYSTYEYWNFYLNNGSEVSFSACYESGDYEATFYLIRGSKNNKKWTKDPSNTRFAVKYEQLSSKCQTISYRIQHDDLYFFSFYSDSYLHTAITLNIEFQFNRTVYHISQDNTVRNCSFPLDGYSSCSIGVPMSSGYTAVLSLNTSLPVDYDNGVNVNINCQPHAWFYAVVVVCSVLPVIIVFVLVIVCVCILARRSRKKYLPIAGSNATTGMDAEGSGNVTAPKKASIIVTPGGPTANPPPFNPGYSPAGRYIGGTTAIPPVYS